MEQTENEKFGNFVLQLRKEKGMTQKELADLLYVSDKTVSKWERGLSMPNVSLLIPISEALGVTVTELLKGERITETASLDIKEVDDLIAYSMDMSSKEREQRKEKKRKWSLAYIGAAAVGIAEVFLALWLYRKTGMEEILGAVAGMEGLLFLFGAWMCLFVKEELPSYYDENKIHFVSDGVFRMNMPGIHFNNSNWPHILNVCRIWLLGAMLVYPGGYLLLRRLFFHGVWGFIWLGAGFALLLSFTLSVYKVGKKYE